MRIRDQTKKNYIYNNRLYYRLYSPVMLNGGYSCTCSKTLSFGGLK